MISQPFTIFRINKMGKPYVQSTDPSYETNLSVNDMWLNPTEGTFKTWNGSSWDEMQWGESALMDDCIANRMLANDISANKITAGTLSSADGTSYFNLDTGEAELLNLKMGGEVEGNIIATSSNELTRVRLRGREGEKDITAGVIFEERDEASDDVDWDNAGQIYFSYANRQTFCAIRNYQIGAYNGKRPSQAYNAGSADGLMWRSISQDWLSANYVTYHGMRLATRDTTSDSFTNVTPVLTALGTCVSGTAIVGEGVVTCTFQMNDVMRIDFDIKILTSGSGSSAYGISRNLLRQLNSEIPVITPVSGGVLQMYNSSGNLIRPNSGYTMMANGTYWQPAYMSSNAFTGIAESSLTFAMTIVGTCYGTYTLGD